MFSFCASHQKCAVPSYLAATQTQGGTISWHDAVGLCEFFFSTMYFLSFLIRPAVKSSSVLRSLLRQGIVVSLTTAGPRDVSYGRPFSFIFSLYFSQEMCLTLVKQVAAGRDGPALVGEIKNVIV